MADNHQVAVHVAHSALIEGKGRAGLPIETVRRIACDIDRIIVTEDEHGEPLSVGRKTRVSAPRVAGRLTSVYRRYDQFPAAFGLPAGHDISDSEATLPVRLALVSAAVW